MTTEPSFSPEDTRVYCREMLEEIAVLLETSGGQPMFAQALRALAIGFLSIELPADTPDRLHG